MRILVIHGPNLDLLGARSPEIYGTATLEEVDAAIHAAANDLGIEVSIHQTAREGGIIELLNSSVGEVDGAVVNPAAYSHTSRAISETFTAVPYPVIEVHISNIHAREEWRHTSVTAAGALGVIAGLGWRGYLAALRWFAERSE